MIKVDDMLEKIKEFTQVVKQQKLSPILVQFKKELFEDIKQQLIEQQSKVKKMLEAHVQESQNEDKNFKYIIYTSETQKISYLLKSYLRIRLQKIQKYAFYFIKNQNLAEKLLSQSEFKFLKKFTELKYQYLSQNALSLFNKRMQGFDGVQIFFGQNNVEKPFVNSNQSTIKVIQPDLSSFCSARINFNPNSLRYNLDVKVKNIPQHQRTVISSNDIILGPYNQVRIFLESGLAQLV